MAADDIIRIDGVEYERIDSFPFDPGYDKSEVVLTIRPKRKQSSEADEGTLRLLESVCMSGLDFVNKHRGKRSQTGWKRERYNKRGDRHFGTQYIITEHRSPFYEEDGWSPFYGKVVE